MAFHFMTDKGDIASNFLPNDTAFQLGGSLLGGAVMKPDGNIYRTALATPVNPGGTAGDYVVDIFALAAGSFDIVGRGLEFTAMGNVANNTNSKRIKLWWNVTAPAIGNVVSGGTLIADTGAYTTTGAAGYSLTAMIFKTATLNTQLCLHQAAQIGATVGSLVAASTASATESGIIYLAVSANVATATTDISHYFTEIFGMN